MKKLTQHGIIWIICLVISSVSFLFLKIDSDKFQNMKMNNSTSIEIYEEVDNNEESVLDMDIIKGITQLLIDIVRIKF